MDKDIAERFLTNFELTQEAAGWDRPTSIWMVIPDATAPLQYREESLVDYDGDPAELLFALAVKQDTTLDSTRVHGVIASFEGYLYPPHIMRALSELTPEGQQRMLRNMPRPSDFEDRIEMRTVVLVDSNGDVFLTGRPRGSDPITVTSDHPSVDNKLFDMMRALLGIHPKQAIKRVVYSCLDDLAAGLREEREMSETEMNELCERILTAYKIHLPEEYDAQVAMLRKFTHGRFPFNL